MYLSDGQVIFFLMYGFVFLNESISPKEGVDLF